MPEALRFSETAIVYGGKTKRRFEIPVFYRILELHVKNYSNFQIKKVFELRTEELAVLIFKTSSDLEFLVSLMQLKDAEQRSRTKSLAE